MSTSTKNKQQNCFIIMPISDPEQYEKNHFKRVYSHIIKPACEKSDLKPIRADEIKSTNYIVIDVLHRILDSKLAICDLSARNPNVFYELGIRQAFNLPVVLLKDKRTDRVFDIQGLRTLEYDENLRIDTVQNSVKELSISIQKTLKNTPKDVNSLIQLLGIQKAELSPGTKISPELSVILDSLKDISQRLTRIEDSQNSARVVSASIKAKIGGPPPYILPSGDGVDVGWNVNDEPNGVSLGRFVRVDHEGVILRNSKGELFVVPPDDERFFELSTEPF